MKKRREEAAVGAFVLVAAAILVGTLFAIGGGFRARGHAFKTHFAFAGGLESGQTVRFGGIKVGRVRDVRVDPDDSTRIEVLFDVDATTPVKKDSVASISSLSALGDNYLELTTGSRDAPLLSSGSEVRSEPYVSLNDVVARMNALMPNAQRLLEELTATATEMRDALNAENRGNFARALTDLRHILEDGKPKIAAALGSIRGAAAELSPLLAEIQKTSATAEQTLAGAHAVIDENRPDLREAVRALRETAIHARQAVGELSGILGANAGNIDETLDNLRTITENLEAFSDAVRERPASLIRGSSAPDRKPGEPPKKP